MCPLTMAWSLTACTDYLDKSPESDISDTEAYKDFQNFQGFTEELYNCIPDFAKGYWTNSWKLGRGRDTECGYRLPHGVQGRPGRLLGWQSEFDGWQSGWMDRNNFNPGGDRFAKSLWKGAWYGIRKANMVSGEPRTDDWHQGGERPHCGQLYFFRGWFHFELIQYFGGMPYINRVLPSDLQLREPRLSYQACADSIARDFRMAADLLPVDWDNTTVGKNTAGKNQLRVSKLAALGYLGKNYLYAGSPLMNKESQNSPTYNKDYCKKAAEAFGELLAMVEGGQTKYGLLPFKEYSANFYTIDQNGKIPGENKDNSITEAIFRGPSYGWNDTNWGLSKQFGIKRLTDSGVRTMPTANYVNYYGMANGLPLTDEASGFDKSYPWQGRDPRFYHDIVFDGVKVVKGTLKPEEEVYRYAQLYTGGNARDVIEGSRTGYLLYKFIDVTCNKTDDGYGWSHHFHIHLPWMRLSDVYLMYADAAAAGYGTPQCKAGSYSLTAVDAINKVRDRAGVGHVADKFINNTEDFLGEVRRERAVELAFEGFRFIDLRRWMLLLDDTYQVKKGVEFDRAKDSNGNELIDYNNPAEAQVRNLRETVLVQRKFTERHYWYPLPRNDTNMYEGFGQNPGW
jgi:hypothetical protein